MTNQAQGRKKSNFPVQNTVLPGAFWDYTVSGVNYKISHTDFLAALGVTGTIVQDGDVTGTPILDVQGSVNGIRNLEDGPGIATSVSPENGATIEHNFTIDGTGVPIIPDGTIDSPVIRSFVAGDGISVSGSGPVVQISATGTPATTKTVIVNLISDFPAPVAGVITLDDDTEYAIRNDITTANRFVLGNNCVLDGSDNITVALTYTGVGIMFTSVDKNWTVKSITMNCASGTFIDFDGTGAEIFQLKNSVVIADTLGTIDDFGGIHVDDTQYQVTTDGFLFGGVNGVILIESALGTIAAGTFYDLGTATFTGFTITEAFTTLNGTSVFLDGAADSVNIITNDLGSVHNCRFFGTGTPLQTIAVSDIRWQFALNDNIRDTCKDCLMSQVANAVATTISVTGTPVKLAGAWTEEDAFFFSTDATGEMTYIGEKVIEVDVAMSFSAAPVSGSNKSVNFFVALNGSPVVNSRAFNNISTGDPSRTTLLWRLTLSPNDFVEAFVANDTDTVDILVTDAVLRLS